MLLLRVEVGQDGHSVLYTHFHQGDFISTQSLSKILSKFGSRFAFSAINPEAFKGDSSLFIIPSISSSLMLYHNYL